jgi:hypothetical protein
LLAGLLTYFLGSVKALQLNHRSCMNRKAQIYSVKASQLDHRSWTIAPSHAQKSQFPLTKTIAPSLFASSPVGRARLTLPLPHPYDE